MISQALMYFLLSIVLILTISVNSFVIYKILNTKNKKLFLLPLQKKDCDNCRFCTIDINDWQEIKCEECN
jgi:hypothetical protein